MNPLFWIEVASIIAQILPQIILAVEVPGNGPEKRAAVIAIALQAINMALVGTGNTPLSPELLANFSGFVGNIVDVLVALFNKTGKLQHTRTVVVQG